VNDDLSSELKSLLMHHVLSQEGITEAVFENDMEKAFRIFSHDLAVQKLPLCEAKILFNEMCEKTKQGQL
jgi:alpha-galactosidase/6-phospho-beta-glucosidase family protein